MLALLALAASGCDFSAAHAYCARLDECRELENSPGDNEDSDEGRDDVAVCTVAAQASVDAINANTEPECHELADAQEAVFTCAATLDCKDLLSNAPGSCKAEYDAFGDLLERLSQRDKITCESFTF